MLPIIGRILNRALPYRQQPSTDPRDAVLNEIYARRMELGIDDGYRPLLIQPPTPTAPIDMAAVMERTEKREQRMIAHADDPDFLLMITEMFNAI